MSDLTHGRRRVASLVAVAAALLLAAPASAGWGHRSKTRHASPGHAFHAGAWGDGPGWHRGGGRGHRRGWGHGWAHGTGWYRASVCNVLEVALSRSRMGVFAWAYVLFGCEPEPAPDPVPEWPLASPPDDTLLDETGAAFADLGRVEIDEGIVRVPLASALVDPVVILGPPTTRDAEPGVARVRGVDDGGFQVHFDEWRYLDGVHPPEATSYLALASGRHRLADGTELEVGSLEVGGTRVWADGLFAEPFAEPPQLFLTVQTANEDDPVTVRAREVDALGFQAALFEEEGSDGARGTERVGYLAVVSPAGSGRLATADGSLPYLLREVALDGERLPVLSTSLFLEEETSADDETDHDMMETVAFLAVGADVFAQDQTTSGGDTASVRRIAPEHGPVMEWGTLPEVDDGWHTVPLARDYEDPVVVVGPMSTDDPEPGVLRVRNVGPDAFEMRVQEWSYLDGAHGPERAFYIVADPGVQALGGLVLEAGRVDTSLALADGMEEVVFTFPFPDVPGVFASVTTDAGGPPLMVRASDRTPEGFALALQGEEAAPAPPVETVGWIAIQAGDGLTSDGRSVSVFDASVDYQSTEVPFPVDMDRRFPTVLAQMVSVFGADPAEVRYDALSLGRVHLRLEEEQSVDDEVWHYFEDVAVFAAE